jgi:hypothetical protein
VQFIVLDRRFVGQRRHDIRCLASTVASFHHGGANSTPRWHHPPVDERKNIGCQVGADGLRRHRELRGQAEYDFCVAAGTGGEDFPGRSFSTD